MVGTAQPGDVINGKYLIDRIIGRGGVGYVAAARHLVLEGPVALKFLLPEHQGQVDACQRFLREARAVARLKSKHVVRVQDAESSPLGPYFVMEYLEGQDLAGVVRCRGGLPVPEAVDLLLQACEAIEEAHALRILHRDIKPSNLFLARTKGGASTVKILDFGLSKSLGESDDAGDLTESNRVLGSPHFMAPEQIRTPRDVDERADVWALGATLFNLLTGRVPFEGSSMMEVCGALLCGPRPGIVGGRPDVPRALEACVLRCLKVERSERFASVHDLARALASFAPREPAVFALATTPPRHTPSPEARVARGRRTQDFGATRRKAALGALVAALGLGGVAIVAVRSSVGRLDPSVQASRSPVLRATWVPGAFESLAETDRRSSMAPPAPGAAASKVRAPSPTLGNPQPSADPRPALAVAERPSAAPARDETTPSLLGATKAPHRPAMVPLPSGQRGETTAPPPAASCAEPFYIDDRGLKTVRPECL